jgi:hypothetical protein
MTDREGQGSANFHTVIRIYETKCSIRGEKAIPINFLDYAFDIRKRASVLEVWKTVEPHNAINLRLCLGENVRV